MLRSSKAVKDFGLGEGQEDDSETTWSSNAGPSISPILNALPTYNLFFGTG